MRKSRETQDRYSARAERFEVGIIRRIQLGKPIDLSDLETLLFLRRKSREACKHQIKKRGGKNSRFCIRCGKHIHSQSKKARRAG